MFSTVDAETSRFARVWLESASGVIPARIPPELEKRVAALRAAPSQSSAEELADRLAERSWNRVGARRRRLASAAGAKLLRHDTRFLDVAAEAATGPSSGPGLPVERIRVEVWKYVFEPETGQLVARPVLVARSRERTQP
jgi:hypothetical protein